MKTYLFKGLLQEKGWISPAYVTVNKKGKIKTIDTQFNRKHPITKIEGYALPSFQNAHSHAFQYAMAGLAEKHDNKKSDDFWSWRNAMYQLALSITPEQLEHIATMLYAQMVKNGFTHVAEFHYLHHQPNGSPYPNLAEMGQRLINAAKTVGINITLIPIFYQMGGFGIPALEQQKRFISNTIEEYYALLDASKKACKTYKGAKLGIGIHSLRGVKGEDIIALSKNEKYTRYPFHIHIAEQLKEVEDCIQFYNKRPVEWLLENIELNERYHLVHATHLTPKETQGIANSKANVVLCPSTEGNLGDGLFPLIDFQKMGGNWSIGTDSHIGINPLEELRLLDYGQRLVSHKRNIFNSPTQEDSALYAVQQAYTNGKKAMGANNISYFKIGKKLNAVIYSTNEPLLSTSALKNIPTTILYTQYYPLATICNGKLKNYKGIIKTSNKIQQNFEKSILELGNRG